MKSSLMVKLITLGNCLLVGWLFYQVHSLRQEARQWRSTPTPEVTEEQEPVSGEQREEWFGVLRGSREAAEVVATLRVWHAAVDTDRARLSGVLLGDSGWEEWMTPMELAVAEYQLMLQLFDTGPPSPEVLLELQRRIAEPALPVWRRETALTVLVFLALHGAGTVEAAGDANLTATMAHNAGRAVRLGMASGVPTLQCSALEAAVEIARMFPGQLDTEELAKAALGLWTDSKNTEWVRLSALECYVRLGGRVSGREVGRVPSRAFATVHLRQTIMEGGGEVDSYCVSGLEDPALIREVIWSRLAGMTQYPTGTRWNTDEE